MDLMGYAILERVAIVAAAALVGYWGYRIYLAEKSVGLVFMGLSVLILVGALATGAGYVRSLGAGMQMAGSASGPEPVAAPARPLANPVEVAAGVPDEATADPDEGPFLDPPPETVATVVPVIEAAVPPQADRSVEEAGEEVEEPEDQAIPLATGEELGGRIVSVKSDNVSLEWSSDSD